MSAILSAAVREKLGTRPARILRLQNRIPCSIQGESQDNLDISIDSDELARARRHHEHLFDLEFEGRDAETAMIKEIQYDALGEYIQHVEFRRVVRGQKTETEVELEFTGHPKGGVLNHLLTHLQIRCLPSLIPDAIEVSVSEMELGHPLLVKDLVLPEGLEVLSDPEAQVAIVNVVRAEEEATPEDELDADEVPTAASESPSTEE